MGLSNCLIERTVLLSLLLSAVVAAAPCPVGDLNGDCTVNIWDMSIFADQWLDPSGCSGPGCADFDGVNRVSSADLAVLSRNWLRTGSPLVINEFMASNGSSITDPQGEYDDWFELYNVTAQAVDIGAMFVTDDLSEPDKWQIPGDAPAQTTIAAHGYLVLWADGDTNDGPLHVDFNLRMSGEEIGLFEPDGSTPLDTVTFGAQITDFSYGRYPDAGNNFWFLSTPTPGSENAGPIAQSPQFSRTGGVFTDSFELILTAEANDTEIRFTTDGTQPTESSALCTEPIAISETMQVRARVFETGLLPSPIVSHTYVELDADMEGFSSNLPIVIVETFGQYIYPWPIDNIYHPTSTIFIDTNDASRATITDEPDFAGRVGMHVRGHSSRGWPKRQYKLEIRDEDNDDISATLLGLPEDSDWVLYAPYSDKTLLRNVLAYRWFGELGEYSVRTRFVELFMNEDGGPITLGDFNNVDPCEPYDYEGDYKGVYVLVENIKRGEDRVDVTALSHTDDTEPNITGGYIVKIEYPRGEPYDPIFSAGGVDNWSMVYPKPTSITSAQQTWVEDYLDTVNSSIWAGTYEDNIETCSFVNYRIMVELAKNNEEFVFSTYCYKDRNGKLFWGPLWDYNITFGNINYGDCWNTVGYHGTRGWGWWGSLFNQDKFQLDYADRWFYARKNVLSIAELMADIDYYTNLLDEAQIRNYRRWPVLGIYLWPNPDWGVGETGWNNPPTTYQGNVDWMKGWILDRLGWLDQNVDYAPPPPVIYVNGQPGDGGSAQAGDVVTMSAPAEAIFYTTDGSDPGPYGSSEGTTLVAESDAKKVLVPTGDIGNGWKGGGEPYDDSGFNSGTFVPGKTGGVGYDRNPDYKPYISYDVNTVMDSICGSCYIRIPFALGTEQLADIAALTLKLRYDDGFVAYINGVKAAGDNDPVSLLWDSEATGLHDDGAAVVFQDFDISDHIGDLHTGTNILAIQGLNYPRSSSDFLLSAELIAGKINEYTNPLTLTATTRIKARYQNGYIWSALNDATYAIGPVAKNLRITEIMYHPRDMNDPNDPNAEYIELQNIGPNTLNLRWVRFTDGISFTFGSVNVPAGGYVVVAADVNVFESVYGTDINVAGQYSGKLDNGGENIKLEDALGNVIQQFEYDDDWRKCTDGDGFSLTIIDPNSADINSWSCKNAWRPSAYVNGSPGADDSGIVPVPGAIVINEVLAHSDSFPNDWIELYNTTPGPIDITGWFLSDSDTNLKKYEFSPTTVIDGYDYLVISEDVNFGALAADPARLTPFALSENGDTVYLTSAQTSVLTGYRQQEDFGASETAVPFGRYQKSTGTFNFIAMSAPTPGAANEYPKIGPVVISEIMYNPDRFLGGSYDHDKYEYVELKNVSASQVTLYDYTVSEPWKFTDGIEFAFPSSPNEVTIPAGGYLLVVKNPDAFSSRYTAPGNVEVLGPYDGQLSNGGEKLEIAMPGDVDNYGIRKYIRIDRVNYSDGWHGDDCSGPDPWPTEPDGQGRSLTRIYPDLYGNDPNNWLAGLPTPGW